MKHENWEIRRKKDKKTRRHKRQKRKEEMFQGARGKIDLQVVARDAETTDSLIDRSGQGQIVAIAGDKQRPRTRGLTQIQRYRTYVQEAEA
jgi:lauroyl/myristoyl acyltransferase